MEMEDLNIGIVVTKDTFKKGELGGRRVLFIPIWLFLLLI
jgi:predicted AAA+ superfamily ATPase